MENELRSRLNDSIETVENKPGSPIAIVNFMGFGEIFLALASLLAEYAVKEVLKKYTEIDPVDLSHKTLNEIENFIKAVVEAGIRVEWEGIVQSSVEKFKVFNDTGDTFLLESIVERNIEGMGVLRNAGAGACIAWMMAAQNVMSALLILHGDNHESVKSAATRYIPEAEKFLAEAYEHNKNRVSDCNDNCEQGTDTKWKCCYYKDGDAHCTKKQRKPDARTRCNQDADSARNTVIQEFEVAIYNPAYVILQKWKDIANG